MEANRVRGKRRVARPGLTFARERAPLALAAHAIGGTSLLLPLSLPALSLTPRLPLFSPAAAMVREEDRAMGARSRRLDRADSIGERGERRF